MFKFIFRVVSTLMLVWSMSATALPAFTTAGGQITGVSDLLVGSSLYDATFHDLSYAELGASGPGSAIYDSMFSLDATDALVNLLNLSSVMPETIVGCSASNCGLSTINVNDVHYRRSRSV